MCVGICAIYDTVCRYVLIPTFRSYPISNFPHEIHNTDTVVYYSYQEMKLRFNALCAFLSYYHRVLFIRTVFLGTGL